MPNSEIRRFGIFEADLQAGELRRAGLKVKLSGQPFEVLVTLLERPGQVVTREELHRKVWAEDTFVDFEHGLNKAINKVREALGDDADNPRFIETLPRRGYRFLMPLTTPGIKETPVVEQIPAPPPPTAPAQPGIEGAGRNAGRKWWAIGLGLVVVCAFVAAGLYWFRNAPSTRPPSVLQYRQLTADRQRKGEGPCRGADLLVTDGPRVFFAEPSSSLAQVSSSGGDVVRITTPLPCFAFSDISPDKTQILGSSVANGYALDQPLWRLSVANDQAYRLGNLAGRAAAWSPDGQKIAYATGNARSTGNDLYVAAKDGSDPQKLTRIENGFVALIRWSPDGKVLRMLVWNDRASSLWQVSTDGTNLHPIDLFSGAPHTIADMNWTPNGKYFLFTVERANRFNPFIPLGGDIWAIREGKSHLPEKGAKPVQLTTGAMSFWTPTPSPDGKQIFATGGQIRGELARYDFKSQKLEPYLFGISAEQLDFSADGKWITYVTFPEGILWRSKVDGSERTQLTNPPLTANLPHWSPDGTRIAFSGLLPGGFWRIYVVPAEGGKPEVVSHGERFDLDPTWSENGNSLIFGGYMTAVQARIYSVDLATGRESIVPGSEGMWSPRASPDNRYIVAMEAPADRKLLLFDKQTMKWSELMSHTNPGLSWEQWSRDSKFVYVIDFGDRHAPVVYRIRIADRKTDQVAAFEVPEGITGYWVSWAGVTPDGSPLVLRDLSIEEIYALDVDLP